MINFIFPKSCVSCSVSTEHRNLCDDCYGDIKFLDAISCCTVCGLPYHSPGNVRENHYCGRCLNNDFFFSKARSVAVFDGTLRELLHKFKYRRKLNIGKTLSEIFTENIPSDFNSVDIVVPVPIHIKKLREREYNQSAVLAKKLAKVLNCEYDPFLLHKIKDTPPQVNFDTLDKREKNVRNFFSIRAVNKLKEMSVLIVDDVFTTGSTVNECSRVLLEAGADSVQVFTLMRAH